MHPGTVSAVARTGAVALVIAVAAALGLLTGDALREPDGSTLNAGAAGPVSRTADAAFSLKAIAALAAIRDTDASTAAAEDYPDYSLRHPSAQQQASPKRSPSGATLE